MDKNIKCKDNLVHMDIATRAKESMLSDEKILNISKFYKIISDPTRLKILWALDNFELCVCDICEVLKMEQSAISHQLSTLKKYDVVRFRRQGKEVFYSLADYHIKELIDSVIHHLSEKEKKNGD